MEITEISAAGVATAPAAPPRTWVQRRLLDPFVSLLKAGLTPAQLALTVGLGAALGVIPALGLTTVLSAAVALRLRLNVAAMQLVVHVLSPVQVLLLLPLLRWGAILLGRGREVAHLDLDQLKAMIHHQGWGILRLLWRAELGALLLWAVASVPLVLALYVGLQPVFRRVLRRQAATATQPA